jgi:hypothetical protein
MKQEDTCELSSVNCCVESAVEELTQAIEDLKMLLG